MVGTAVLIVQIIGMLPYVEGEQGREARTERIAAVGFLCDVQFTFLVGREPGPSGAEEAGGGCRELFLEVVEAAESTLAENEALKNEKIIAMASKFKIWCKCFTTLDPIYNRVRTSFSTTSIY